LPNQDFGSVPLSNGSGSYGSGGIRIRNTASKICSYCTIPFILVLVGTYQATGTFKPVLRNADPDPNPESGFRICRISTGTYVFGLLDPDALVRGIDPDPSMNESGSFYQQSKILKKHFLIIFFASFL
jgi:hypothetical protein